jgi:transposase
MERYKTGISRTQLSMDLQDFESLIMADNPVRAIDAIVDRFDVKQLGFQYSQTKHTGRKAYDPSDMLKLYLYGYFNGIRSSRKLERECSRNVELMWLLGCLKPDFKTIADFRKNNHEPIQKTFQRFSLFCDQLGLLGKEVVAIDGSKFRASNNSNKYWTRKKLADKREEYRKAAEKYINLLDTCDTEEEGSRQVKGYTRKELNERLDWIQHKVDQLEAVAPLVEENGDVSLTDPDARKMKHLNGANEISHNVQIGVDDKHHIVVAVDVSSQAVDYEQFHPMATQSKENLCVDTLVVLGDRGYFSGEQMHLAEKEGIVPIVAKPDKSKALDPKYSISNFIYDEENDVYICPEGKHLPRQKKRKNSNAPPRYGNKHVCADCPARHLCTQNKDGKYIVRDEFQAAADRAFLRVYENRPLYKKRKTLVEHIFGTVKASFGFRYLTVRGNGMVKTDTSLYFLTYNLKRAINILGSTAIVAAM